MGVALAVVASLGTTGCDDDTLDWFLDVAGAAGSAPPGGIQGTPPGGIQATGNGGYQGQVRNPDGSLLGNYGDSFTTHRVPGTTLSPPGGYSASPGGGVVPVPGPSLSHGPVSVPTFRGLNRPSGPPVQVQLSPQGGGGYGQPQSYPRSTYRPQAYPRATITPERLMASGGSTYAPPGSSGEARFPPVPAFPPAGSRGAGSGDPPMDIASVPPDAGSLPVPGAGAPLPNAPPSTPSVPSNGVAPADPKPFPTGPATQGIFPANPDGRSLAPRGSPVYGGEGEGSPAPSGNTMDIDTNMFQPRRDDSIAHIGNPSGNAMEGIGTGGDFSLDPKMDFSGGNSPTNFTGPLV